MPTKNNVRINQVRKCLDDYNGAADHYGFTKLMIKDSDDTISIQLWGCAIVLTEKGWFIEDTTGG